MTAGETMRRTWATLARDVVAVVVVAGAVWGLISLGRAGAIDEMRTPTPVPVVGGVAR